MKHCQTAFDNIFPELINCDKPEDRLPKHLREPGKDLAGVSEATHAKRSCGDKVGGLLESGPQGPHSMSDPALKLYHYQVLKVQVIFPP